MNLFDKKRSGAAGGGAGLQKGQLSLLVLIFAAVAVLILSGLLVWANNRQTSAAHDVNKAQAFDVAESGIEYYRWHLAHAHTDYQDGTGHAGPYVHPFYNKNGVQIGQFSLAITAPPTGSTVVTVTSTGTILTDTTVSKTITVKMAIASFAKYAAVLNAAVRFGPGTEVFGPIESNGGIHFDGLAHNLVSSAVASYQDPDEGGPNVFGVHTEVAPIDPLPPSPVPNRPDVFIAGRQFPVPAVDFTGITSTLSSIQSSAQSAGFYRGSSGKNNYGYDIVLKTNDTFDLYTVTKLTSAPNGCSNSESQDGWGTWSINAETLLGNYPIPANGLIFLGDNVWVRGQINTARVTIASGVFPDNVSTRTSITVNNSLTYTNFNGSDIISLIAQNNINAGLYSDDTLSIDGALMAVNGRVGRYYYSSSCSANYIRTSITLDGMIASNQRYGFAYTDSTGYITRNIIYDANLFYNPPPSFPLTSDNYDEIYWDEVN
ncbi:MAG: hypothetical protein ABR875_02995 [Minisyncoccia bacterium]